jgi:ribonucleoside-diphosphate reductase alpha chain
MAEEMQVETVPQNGLKIPRIFTKPGESPFAGIEWERRSSVIKNPDGSIVFQMSNVEVPKFWSQVATDVLAQKYFRKTGVPQLDSQGKPLMKDGKPMLGVETSAKQIVRRLAGCWRYWGERYHYFASVEDAQSFEDEIVYMLIHQLAAPNSPQWFNTGLHWAYGITGPAQGHYYIDPDSKELKESQDAYSRPQVHACFIQSVKDDLVNEGGIMDLWTKDARIFKYGSGTGSNFSNLRGKGEKLSGGGISSGVMSFLKIGDATAGSIKSGGTTRRAAKMVILDIDHPEIEDFIDWKYKEEQKARILIGGGLPADYEGEAYQTVSGQNSNNSVRVPNQFMQSVIDDGSWDLIGRTDKSVAKTVKAKHLWSKIGQAAWACADPGLQFDDIINEWHTCPASGRQRASNPCSEYMFLDDTACNLASLNLMKFYNVETRKFEVESFKHAARLWTIVLEISVLMSQAPSRNIALGTYNFRTLGLGYTNLGTLLMMQGIPYDSDEGRAICAAITSLMTGESYATSAELAKFLGPFVEFEKNREHMLRVIRNHRRAAYNADATEYEGLTITPPKFHSHTVQQDLMSAALDSWDRALELGRKYGYRNAQTTLIAPTGTISLVMDCDTTGIEPEFAVVKFKKLAGGGYFKIINRSISAALKNLGYNDLEIRDSITYVMGRNGFRGAPYINDITLIQKGFTPQDLAKVEAILPTIFDIRHAFSVHYLGKETLERLGFSSAQYNDSKFDMLKSMGFSEEEIRAADEYVCGTQTLEGAPHLKEEHYAVFDCANKCGKIGRRFIPWSGHLKMMAAAQPFLSGSISKTINMPNDATVEDVEDAYMEAWKLMLKSIAIYRDGSKASQPLLSKSATSVELRKPVRRRLPDERRSITHKFKVGDQEGYITAGLYEDGTPGEIFVKIAKEGSALAGLMDALSIGVSIGLQYGVPLNVYVDKFAHTRFEPLGWTDHPQIRYAKSIVDYIFRWLALKFLPKEDQAAIGFNSNTLDTFVMEDKRILPEKSAKIDTTSDAPPCKECGSLMVRSGTCYVCPSCGSTSGCA